MSFTGCRYLYKHIIIDLQQGAVHCDCSLSNLDVFRKLSLIVHIIIIIIMFIFYVLSDIYGGSA